MKADSDTDIDNLRLILRLIGDIGRRLAVMDYARFAQDNDELDLTAFRIGVIGEASRKLTPRIRDRHPEILWTAIYGMRNIIFHNYYGIDSEILWSTATNSLAALAAVCEQELARLSSR